MLMLLSWSCEESLPPRSEPTGYLSTALDANEGIVVFRGGSLTGDFGSFLASMTNKYDEALQGTARMHVTVDVWLYDDPAQRATISMDELNLVSDWILAGDTVTLGVDSAAVFHTQWNQQTSGGLYFYQFVELHHRYTPDGVEYLESDPVKFVARASIQVFSNVPPEATEYLYFTLVYHIFA